METKGKIIPSWWSDKPSPGNFGDILNPFILEKVGVKTKRVGRETNGKLIAIGSTAKFIKPRDVVWGTGIMWNKDPIEKRATYLAVRGPLTGEKVGCDVYGDPGLLCSKFFPFPRFNHIPFAVIHHYIDWGIRHPFHMINTLHHNPLLICEIINRCETLVSSSLHGIIVAHSYGIPCGWWRPSDRLDGDDSKFHDYALSVGIELTPHTDPAKVPLVLPKKERIEEIQNNLINAIQSHKFLF